MNLRNKVLLLATTTLAACSTTSSRVALFETGNQKLEISGSAKNGATTDELVITVNDQTIIRGTIFTVQPTANLYANSAKAAELSF